MTENTNKFLAALHAILSISERVFLNQKTILSVLFSGVFLAFTYLLVLHNITEDAHVLKIKSLEKEIEMLNTNMLTLRNSQISPSEKLIIDGFYAQAPSTQTFFKERWKEMNYKLEGIRYDDTNGYPLLSDKPRTNK